MSVHNISATGETRHYAWHSHFQLLAANAAVHRQCNVLPRRLFSLIQFTITLKKTGSSPDPPHAALLTFSPASPLGTVG